ncbi:class I SAM-dependent methyltransferase [Micromonospora sp. HM134]|uniref:class I SAM-dependent methyltransferase n=1 Tax=Micromonospora sp. HM134 TaxID=2583243 RepID=UPI001198AD87|nr:class I SAM-dependent methyltransferase [Micromonospora sp. HM134]QDY08691.1 class I SAM-dependent methyltransferase [Micromonospora sp. HM134]
MTDDEEPGRPLPDTDYRTLNRASWDDRAAAHAASPDYAVDRFAADPAYLSEVVRFDLPRLGDVAGLRGVHLQCHIGTDTVSLHRLGARMTGLDFSGASLAQARALAGRTGAAVDFVQADVYDAPDVLGVGNFDLVYTGVGALCWLPDIRRWAGVVAALLRPGGRLFLREGHPMLWALDETRPDGLLAVEHPYFERAEPLVWDEGGTYVSTEATFTHNTTHEWNHGLGEVVTALLDAGFELTMFHEHDSAPWDALPGRQTRDAYGEWRLTERPWRLPQTYTLQARRR